MSLVGGIQPEKLRPLVNTLVDDGFLQRMFLYRGEQVGEYIDRKPDAAARERYERLITTATELPDDINLTVTLHPAAHVHRQRVEKLASSFKAMPWAPPALVEHLSKWPVMLARLLVAMHAAELLAEHGEIRPVVLEGTAERTANLMLEFFLPNAISIYREFFGGKTNPDRDHALWIANYLLASPRTIVTRRDQTRLQGARKGRRQYRPGNGGTGARQLDHTTASATARFRLMDG